MYRLHRYEFSHSGIVGSKVVCTSPTLIAAYHALHRHQLPRHPLYALSSLRARNCHCHNEPPRATVTSPAVILFTIYLSLCLPSRLSKIKLPSSSCRLRTAQSHGHNAAGHSNCHVVLQPAEYCIQLSAFVKDKYRTFSARIGARPNAAAEAAGACRKGYSGMRCC